MTSPSACLSCGRDAGVVPLISMQYRDGVIFVCPQCLPTLIHQPARLGDKIEGADGFGAVPHDH